MQLAGLKFDLKDWLESVSHGDTPEGKSTTVHRIDPGGVVEITVYNQHAKGLERCQAASAGDVRLVQRLGDEVVGGVRHCSARFEMSAPSVIHVRKQGPGDAVERTTYVCATPSQMADACAAMS